MQPVKQKIMIEVEYWDCGNAKHRHKTEIIALKCMQKTANKKPAREPEHSRNIQIARDLLNGKRQIDIAKEVGRSPTTVRNAAKKVFRTAVWCEIQTRGI